VESRGRLTDSRKVLLSALLAVLALLLGGVGTWATFTGSMSVTQGSLGSGTMSLTVPAAGATNRLTLGASDIAPGDTMQRAVNLTVGGTVDMTAIALTTTAPTSSALDTNATHGLQLAIDRCSQAWTESGSSPAFTYACGGSTSTVLASRAVIGSSIALSNLALTAGSTNYLRVTLSFPTTADDTYQGLTSAITYQFAGTQRAGTNK
jgi:predicted ribosomally synthesized peptide with SipW-like signal peptide